MGGMRDTNTRTTMKTPMLELNVFWEYFQHLNGEQPAPSLTQMTLIFSLGSCSLSPLFKAFSLHYFVFSWCGFHSSDEPRRDQRVQLWETSEVSNIDVKFAFVPTFSGFGMPSAVGSEWMAINTAHNPNSLIVVRENRKQRNFSDKVVKRTPTYPLPTPTHPTQIARRNLF